MIGAQASNDQLEKILSYIDIGKQEGAKVLTGGERARCWRVTRDGLLRRADRLRGHNTMRVFQEEIFGPVLSVTRSTTRPRPCRSPTTPSTGSAPACGPATAMAYRDGPRHPGRPGVDQLLPRLPAHAAFGGYKGSGIGRENHKMMLDHYQQTKNLLVSYSPDAQGFF
jgi:aldehyde dehydrogenase